MRESFAIARAPSPMMKAVLKTLAISFGGGLALGAGIRLTQGPAKSRREPEVDLDPLLSRLQNVESRIGEMESGVSGEAVSSGPLPSEVLGKTLVAFEARLASQVNDVEHLRDDVRRVNQCLADLDSQLPVLVQSTVDVRFQQAEKKLQHDFEEVQSRSMTAFVETLQTKVVERISTLEVNLAEQSQAIGKLRDASARSDENLQKMLVGIEQLVDQSRASPPAPAPVTASPPVPMAVVRESPASVYEAASAIKRKEPASDSVTVRVYTIGAESEPVTSASQSAIVEAPLNLSQPAEEISKETPKPAKIPDIPIAAASETVHASPVFPGERLSAPMAASVAAEPAAKPQPAVTPSVSELPDPEPLKPEESYEWVNKIGLELLAPRSKSRLGWRIPLVIGLAAGLILIVGLLYSGMLQHLFESSAAPQASTLASTSPAPEPPAPAQSAKPSETSVPLQVAREYQRRKDWMKAETSFRAILDANPADRDAAIGLSDVLYQEQKYEESAAVLNKLRSAKAE
jgi:uncharacterized coiled-coil protein SlyX